MDLKSRISNLNCEIRAHFFAKRKFKVRKGILPGNSKTLWSAVNIAKNNGHNVIPENMCQNNVPVVNISESFAEFFDKKVSNIVNQTVISDNVYSGRRKIHAEVEMFMTEFNINDCIKSLKIKNTEDNINFSKHILFDVPDDVFETIIFLHLILTKTI